jgi:spore germination cell wall hydrolase CwlJ-like protein
MKGAVLYNGKTGIILGGVFAVLFVVVFALWGVLKAPQKTDLSEAAVKVSPLNPSDLTEYNKAWVASLPEPTLAEQAKCLAQALYFEARGEPVLGQLAVGDVILNRKASKKFPGSICDVVDQGMQKGKCQFSFRCSKKKNTVANQDAFKRAAKLARFLLTKERLKFAGGAAYFHTTTIHPSWAKRMVETVRVGNHVFLADPSDIESKEALQ